MPLVSAFPGNCLRCRHLHGFTRYPGARQMIGVLASLPTQCFAGNAARRPGCDSALLEGCGERRLCLKSEARAGPALHAAIHQSTARSGGAFTSRPHAHEVKVTLLSVRVLALGFAHVRPSAPWMRRSAGFPGPRPCPSPPHLTFKQRLADAGAEVMPAVPFAPQGSYPPPYVPGIP